MCTMKSWQSLILFNALILVIHIHQIESSHFRGGTITWRPLNSTPNGANVEILIRQRYSWRRGSYYCDDNTIASGSGYIGDYWTIYCYTGTCSAYTTYIYTEIRCTDYSIAKDVSSGEIYYRYTVPLNSNFSIGYVSGNWFANLAVGANGYWSIITRINTFLRPDGLINNSPIANTLPVIYKPVNIQHVHVVQVSDLDQDMVECRWSTRYSPNFNSYDECYDVCNGVPGAILFEKNCTLVFSLSTPLMYYAVALQIEDYYNISYSTPMSSVPLQFLFYGYTEPSGCKTPPAIIGNRPNRACLGVLLPKNINETVVAQVNCPGKVINDFISSSPIGLTKGSIVNLGSGIFQVTVQWSPTNDQIGPQGFCMAAVDDTDVPSEQWCVTFLIGYLSPNLIPPSMVQGSVSPVGTVFANHSIFSIQATDTVNRPQRNSTYVRFFDAATDQVVAELDCGHDTNVSYIGTTVIFRVLNPPWIPGHSYYILLDNGVASGTEFCKPESDAITDRHYWTFNIWNSALSSTTSTTTTPPTVGTVTTRAPITTTPNTQMTTTGIVLTSTTTVTTTTSTSTSSTSTTTEITMTVTTTISPIQVLYPKDLEKQCEQPIIIGTVVSLLTTVPIHIGGMFLAFMKFSKTFNPNLKKIQSRASDRQRWAYSTR